MTLDVDAMRPLLNRVYLARVAEHPDQTDMQQFQQYLLASAGLQLHVKIMSDHLGRTGYTIRSIDVQDQRLYTWWIMQWS